MTHHDWSKLTDGWKRSPANHIYLHIAGIYTVRVYDNGEVDPGGEGLGLAYTLGILEQALKQYKQCEVQEAVPVLTPTEKALSHLTSELEDVESYSVRRSLFDTEQLVIQGPGDFRIDVSDRDVWVSPGVGFSIHDNVRVVDTRYDVMQYALTAYDILRRPQ